MTVEQVEEERRKTLAKSQASTLTILGDLSGEDVLPPDTVLFVCKVRGERRGGRDGWARWGTTSSPDRWVMGLGPRVLERCWLGVESWNRPCRLDTWLLRPPRASAGLRRPPWRLHGGSQLVLSCQIVLISSTRLFTRCSHVESIC